MTPVHNSQVVCLFVLYLGGLKCLGGLLLVKLTSGRDCIPP